MHSLFQELYDKYHTDLFTFLVYMVKNREQAEDLVQEVYIKVLRSYDSFEGKSSEKTWLFSIAKHVAIDWLRSQKRKKEHSGDSFEWATAQLQQQPSPEDMPEEHALLMEDIRWLYECLDQCNEKQKTVLVLRYIQSLSIAETAEILDWSESKVKTTQHRAIKKLQRLMNASTGKGGSIHEKTSLDR
ncbi:RNA polymerase sigma factor SigX [Bacillaceae bacterium SIJ1]|uniref:RNA polymerase sigma factor SigX n=1 Tax=Litoribacterium kuwaitense TaxID=1398745 RepID=UPI0013EB01A0|nr:RNA polymerase sigma factor SigX [Litoribacterium kuwaitense]NGP43672.1 RNA polymerase sigma factor SigX [Litoribacterium kuwaitense]